MSLYQPLKIGDTVAVAVCDRCHIRMPYDKLEPDVNAKGLRVCKECADVLDPYRKPQRRSESIGLKYPRPDTQLV